MKSSLLITLCFLLLFCTAAFGQELAKEAFNDGRKAFAEEKYDEALRHFLKARETDAKNPEVHIWLGNAYLALGRADDAAESWEKALNIAPDNETLKARLERLRGVVADIDKDIATIEMLLEQRLYKSALFRARETLKKPASVQKRAHIEMLIAEALWGNGENQRALEQVLGWEIRYPEAPDEGKARARLIHGRALAGLGCHWGHGRSGDQLHHPGGKGRIATARRRAAWARRPPADPPAMPMRAGSTPSSPARDRR